MLQDSSHWVAEKMEERGPEKGSLYKPEAKGLVILKVLTGQCQIRAGNRFFDLGGSHLLLVDRQLEASVIAASGDLVLEVVHLNLHVGQKLGEGQEVLQSKYPPFKAYVEDKPQPLLFNDTFALIAPMVGNIKVFFSALEGEDREGLIHLYLCYLLMVIVSGGQEGQVCLQSQNPYVRKAKNYIEKHYMASLSVHEIAGAVGVHPAYLHKLFFEETGLKIGQYIYKKRMEYVKFLLIHTEFSMDKIAGLTGFSTAAYLSRAFKKQEGMAPSTFRNRRNITCFYEKFESFRQGESR